MAKDQSHWDGNRGGRRVTREVGQRGNTRPRLDKSVRRARQVETDGRLKAAKAEQEAHERKLRHLELVLADQPHEAPNRWASTPEQEAIVADLMATARDMAKELAARQPRPRLVASPEHLKEAMDLVEQGYHVERVAARTGLDVDSLRHLVGNDGYVR